LIDIWQVYQIRSK